MHSYNVSFPYPLELIKNPGQFLNILILSRGHFLRLVYTEFGSNQSVSIHSASLVWTNFRKYVIIKFLHGSSLLQVPNK